MFSKNVIIIGAGAGVPYGFPTNTEIKEILRSTLFNPREGTLKLLSGRRLDIHSLGSLKQSFCEVLKKYIKDSENLNLPIFEVEKQYRNFVGDLLASQEVTIDSFLSKRKDLREFGKVIYGSVIRYFETLNPIQFYPDDWIQLVLNLLLPKNLSKDEVLKALSNFPIILTFNYDRLLEEAIFLRLRSLFQIPEKQAMELVNRIGINHIYGKIGSKNFSIVTSEGLSPEKTSIIGESQNIEILDLEKFQQNEVIFGTYPAIIEKAEKIYFLGFGFDKLNLKILFGKNMDIPERINRSIYSTNIGLNQEKIDGIKILFKNKIHLYENKPIDSLKLLRDLVPIQMMPREIQKIQGIKSSRISNSPHEWMKN